MIESRFAPAALLVSLVLFSTTGAGAQDFGTAGGVTACCMIVATDANTGIVTVKVNETGNIFQFKPNGFSPVDGLRSSAALASLKPGQAVYANFTNHQVSLDGRTSYGMMTSAPRPLQPPDGGRYSPIDGARPMEPCCGIVAIDANTGIVTVKVNETGSVLQFKPDGYSPIDGMRSKALAGLKPGQSVYVNFTSHQLSLDGRTVWAGHQILH